MILNDHGMFLAHDLCMSEKREDISRKSCRFDFALNVYPICYVQILISLEINWLIWARIGINMNVNHQTWCVFLVEWLVDMSDIPSKWPSWSVAFNLCPPNYGHLDQRRNSAPIFRSTWQSAGKSLIYSSMMFPFRDFPAIHVTQHDMEEDVARPPKPPGTDLSNKLGLLKSPTLFSCLTSRKPQKCFEV